MSESVAVEILLQMGGDIGNLIEWILDHKAKTEIVSVSHWTIELFYIEVIDNRPGWKHPEEMRLGFTVDVYSNRIFWTNDDDRVDEGFTKGGNCFVRTNKWKSLLIKEFGAEIVNQVHWYKNSYL